MCDWLPEMFPVSPWGMNTYQKLYALFCRDIRDAGLRLSGTPIFIPREADAEGFEQIFWHLTTRNPKPVPRRLKPYLELNENDRMPDPRRCERMPWINPVVSRTGSAPEILVWDYEEGDGRIKTYLWLKACDFVVIFKKLRSGRRLLVTSFYVDNKYTRNNFQKKYDACCPAQEKRRDAQTASPSPSTLTSETGTVDEGLSVAQPRSDVKSENRNNPKSDGAASSTTRQNDE